MSFSPSLSLAFILASCIAVTAVEANEIPDGQPMVSVRTDSEQGREFNLQRWASDSFHADLNHVIERLGETHGQEKLATYLDAAELYLAHMLLFEASTVLDGILPAKVEHQRRFDAIKHAARLLQGQPIENFAASPLNVASRADAGFWRSLQAIATADVGMLNSHFDASIEGLGMQSGAVLRAMLPVFCEAAIALDHTVFVQATLSLIGELPELSQAPVGHFLRGRAEERRGNQSSALDAYFKAAEGWDQYAVRARLAVADMSLANGSPGALLAAQSVLSEGAEAWRGNQFEVEVLRRLIRLYESTDNNSMALLTLGKLLVRFPGKREAEASAESARRLLKVVYEKGSEGAYPMAEWMNIHLQLLPFFRQEPEFARQTEVFADYLLNLGATDLAAQEFGRALQLVHEVLPDEEPATAEAIFRINLKLAKAQLQAGLSAEAKSTLETMKIGSDLSHREQHSALSAQVVAELGDNAALFDLKIENPTAAHLRDLGRAHAEEGRWTESNDAYKELWSRFPQEFFVDDATMLLIATNRSNDVETRTRIIQSFPSLTSSEPFIALAESLDTVRPKLLPLKSENAIARLQELESAFKIVQDAVVGE